MLVYPTIGTSIATVKSEGPQAHIFKADLSKANCQIPVDAWDILCLGYKLNGSIYFNPVL